MKRAGILVLVALLVAFVGCEANDDVPSCCMNDQHCYQAYTSYDQSIEPTYLACKDVCIKEKEEVMRLTGDDMQKMDKEEHKQLLEAAELAKVLCRSRHTECDKRFKESQMKFHTYKELRGACDSGVEQEMIEAYPSGIVTLKQCSGVADVVGKRFEIHPDGGSVRMSSSENKWKYTEDGNTIVFGAKGESFEHAYSFYMYAKERHQHGKKGPTHDNMIGYHTFVSNNKECCVGKETEFTFHLMDYEMKKTGIECKAEISQCRCVVMDAQEEGYD